MVLPSMRFSTPDDRVTPPWMATSSSVSALLMVALSGSAARSIRVAFLIVPPARMRSLNAPWVVSIVPPWALSTPLRVSEPPVRFNVPTSASVTDPASVTAVPSVVIVPVLDQLSWLSALRFRLPSVRLPPAVLIWPELVQRPVSLSS